MSTGSKLLFKKRPFLGLRATMLCMAAILLMAMNHYWTAFASWRDELSVVTYPLTWLVDSPIRWGHLLLSSMSDQRTLLADNAKLRAHEFLLQAKLQKLLALERENVQLKNLLKSTESLGGHVKAAQLLAADLSPELQQVVIDKGRSDRVYIGQPVVDAYGVMGQIVHAGPLASKVLLITDKRSAIPVRDYRSGVRLIAVGGGANGLLNLLHVTATSDVKQGDLLVTSGLGMRFPLGYPVGVVKHFQQNPRQDFVDVRLQPVAHMDRTSQVLLVWPDSNKLKQAVNKELSVNEVKQHA